MEQKTKIRGVRELATFLEIGTNTALRLVTENRLPHYRVGNVFYFDREKIAKLLEQNGLEL